MTPEQDIFGLSLCNSNWHWLEVAVGMLMSDTFIKFKVIEFVFTFSAICK